MPCETIVARGTSIEARELPPEVFQTTDHGEREDSLDLHAQERAMIARALEQFRGNRRHAANALKISTDRDPVAQDLHGRNWRTLCPHP